LPFITNLSLADVVPPFLPVKRKYPVIPPGGESIAHFTGLCTACHLCAAVCPTHVIKPALAQFGISGIFQPVMDYDSSFCNYECNACLKVCPTGALREYSLESKKLIQLGIVNLNKKKCIVYSQDKHCGICAEYCPTTAVFLIPYKKGLPAPETDGEICIGCGACENVCPARPEKAVFVEGNPVHKTAKKKGNLHEDKKNNESRDFPF
jgi:formate hydrogenlyase subunit 6/NADH:ubiquinone oxidoreductase subunit I